LLAKMAGTVDEISNGRLILGLGSGWNEREYDAYGYPFDRRVSRYEEAYEIITKLIRTGSADLDGTYHRAHGLRLVPPARADIPIMIGSTGPRMLAISAPEMDWWNEWWSRFGNHPDGVVPLVARVDEALAAAGRDPSHIVKSVAVLVQMPGGDGRTMGATTNTPPITGSLQDIAEQLLAFADLVDHLQLVVDPITTTSIKALAPVVAAVHRG
jgi:alkanesulfonate monooxygenase SsuD/methylene tetrahydromethanopterin reductase-like flavin-dependent oxidoreductase (luciferase family)